MPQIREHPITGEFLTSDKYDMTTRAYKMMTLEEQKMSNKRDLQYRHMLHLKQIENIQRYEEWAREQRSRRPLQQDKIRVKITA